MVIILNVEARGTRHTVGIVVDTVSDVIDIDDSTVKPMPDLGTHINIEYISGMVPGDNMVMLLNADKLLAPEELSRLECD